VSLSAEQLERIRLLRTPNVGPATYRQLLARFGSAGAALEALPELAARGGGRLHSPAPGTIAAEAARVARAGARYLFHDDADYPELLRQAPGAPPILIARGDTAIAARCPVALVGARNASAAALRLARQFGSDLSRAGHAVVSGLARGIDGAAHKAALAAGGAGTVAVIASGIDIAYPPEHADLQEQIAEEGLLLTELPPGTEPTNRHFPARNRIIAALSAGTVVVEAAFKSGSLITARLAGEFAREVMAVPGSPLDPRSHGCNQLIREGAILVQRAEDVIELVTSFHGTPRSTFREDGGLEFDFAEAAEPAEGTLPDPAAIAALLTTAPVAVDELVRLSGLGAGAVQLALIELELAGRLMRHAGGRVSLT
jgi:DNA processing protein